MLCRLPETMVMNEFSGIILMMPQNYRFLSLIIDSREKQA